MTLTAFNNDFMRRASASKCVKVLRCWKIFSRVPKAKKHNERYLKLVQYKKLIQTEKKNSPFQSQRTSYAVQIIRGLFWLFAIEHTHAKKRLFLSPDPLIGSQIKSTTEKKSFDLDVEWIIDLFSYFLPRKKISRALLLMLRLRTSSGDWKEAEKKRRENERRIDARNADRKSMINVARCICHATFFSV